jgi:hypothetical protein
MRRPILAVSAAALVAPFAPATAHATTAAQTGLFSALLSNPNGQDCHSSLDPAPRCNPTANAITQLADGRQIFWSGLEGFDDTGKANTGVTQWGDISLNSRAAILDLRGKAPKFTNDLTPTTNPKGNPYNEYLPGPFHNNDSVNNDGDLFCADLNLLADGRVITAGGTAYYQEPGVPGYKDYGGIELNGLRNTRIFDPRTNSWSEAGLMNYARWYPALVTQPDGSIIAFSGVTKMIKPYYPNRPADSMANERHVERFDPKTGKWTTLPDSAKKSLPLFPRMHQLPDGRTLFNSAGQVANPMGYAWDEATWNFVSAFDPKTNTWTDLGVNDLGGLPLGFRGTGSSVMLPIKPGDTSVKFLSLGGEPFPWPGGHFGVVPTTLTTVGVGTDSFSSVASGNLHAARWYADGVLLSTGQVFAVNGSDVDHLHAPGLEFPNKTTEMWDPATGEWTLLAAQERPRTYHTTALLLPDGRVLVGGHAPAGTLYGQPTDLPRDTFGMAPGYSDSTFQIFSPPNLFWGQRPVITKVNPAVQTGQTLTVNVDRPADISSIRLVRNTSITHLTDADQRNIELEIVGRTAKAVKVKVPDSNYLPAGPYMLFAHTMSDKGEIPSVSRQVFVDAKMPASAIHNLMNRQAGLAAEELRAGVPGVPVTADPTGSTLPGADRLPDSAVLPGSPIRTTASRRVRPGRRSATLVRRRAR